MPADFKQSANLAGKILASRQVATSCQLWFVGAPTGGTFNVTVSTQTSTATATITYSTTLTAAAIKTALEALANVGTGNATVTGPNGGPYIVVLNVPGAVVSVTLTLLTGGTTPSVSSIPVPVPATVYTVPASTATKVATFVVSNPSVSTTLFTVSVVPSGGAADGTHTVLSRFPLVAGGTAHITEAEGDFWDAGTAVVISADMPVNVKLTGVESS